MNINIKEFSEPCSCGKEHSIFVKNIIIESGALKKLPGILAGGEYGEFLHPLVICDNNTYAAAGSKVLELLPGASYIMLSPEGLHADEHAVQLAGSQFPPDTDLLIAVGSGTIHDITRYCAYETGLDFISVPTAASVDGFVSTVAAMTWHGFKKTLTAVSPIYVVADSSVFSKAPYRLTASGVSDLLGKFTALADWKVSHIVTGEYLCERVCELEYRALHEVCGVLESIRSGDIEACEKLMYALLLSGIAMQMIGNSRPASGSEHHFSHLWEMEAISQHTNAYHGEKVSVGLMTAAAVCHRAEEELAAGRYHIKKSIIDETEMLRGKIRSEKLLKQMLEENADEPLAKINLQDLAGKIPEVIQALSEIPSTVELEGMLESAGCSTTLNDIGLSEDICEASIRISPYARNRLTFIRLLKIFDFDNENYIYRLDK